MRNSYKYTKLYSGAEPEFIEGDVFETIIPLTTGAMTKVGAGEQVSTHVGTQDEYASSIQAGGHVSGHVSGHVGGHVNEHDKKRSDRVISIGLDIGKVNELLEYCSVPRSRSEMQNFCGIKSRGYFREKILIPLVRFEKLFLTVPDKPRSSKQKYYAKK